MICCSSRSRSSFGGVGRLAMGDPEAAAAAASAAVGVGGLSACTSSSGLRSGEKIDERRNRASVGVSVRVSRGGRGGMPNSPERERR